MSPRHEASLPAELTLHRHRTSWQESDPYLFQRGAEPVNEGDRVDSYFRDLLLLADSSVRADKAVSSPILRGRDAGDPDRPGADDDLAGAKERLRVAWATGGVARRDIAATGTAFLPSAGVPMFIADRFATAARNRSALMNRLQVRPLPKGGLKVQVPRFTGGGAVAVQASENTGAQETDPTTALAESPTATIAGMVDASRQLIDMARPGMDEALAADLAADYARQLEQQVIAGSGSSGQTLGLLSVTGITAQTKTNATPTAATNLAAIGDLVQATAAAYGAQPEELLLIMPPRRYDWIITKAGYSPTFPVPRENIVLSTAAVVAGQDRIIVFVPSEVTLFTREPVFRVFPEVGSSTLTVRVQVYGFAALMSNRLPAAIGVSSGTEWAAPTF